MSRFRTLVNQIRGTAAPEHRQTQHTVPGCLCPVAESRKQPDLELFVSAFSDQTTSFPLRRSHPWLVQTDPRPGAPRPAPPARSLLTRSARHPRPCAERSAGSGPAFPRPRGAGQAPSPPLPPLPAATAPLTSPPGAANREETGAGEAGAGGGRGRCPSAPAP